MSDQDTLIDGPLYAKSKRVYPQSVKGPFRTIKWGLLIFALAVYYFVPFIRWTRGPGLPDQAVLIDLTHRRFYFFFIEIWPQEVYYLTGLLIIAAMTLFLMNAVAGRIWCGYLCPQTVWTDLFYAVERFVEGDRRDRMKKDKAGLTPRRVGEIALKHFLWLMIAWWTGGAWVLYFSDAPTLVRDLATLQAPFAAYLWIGILTLTTYVFAGWMREQVCIYMCPWPRIQAALTDEWALNVMYKPDRGEPRMSLKKADHNKQIGAPAGDCIDCHQCVAVCPTGVDIRDGLQLGCVQCGLCIDACDHVMGEIGRPAGLIGYDTDFNIERRRNGEKPIYRLLRARTMLYAAVIAVVAGIMLFTLLTRSFLAIDVLHGRNPVFVMLSDGSIRNDFIVRVINKQSSQRRFVLDVEGLKDQKLQIVGVAADTHGDNVVVVGPDQTREVRLLVTVPPQYMPEHTRDIRVLIRDLDGPETATEREHFIASGQ